MVAGLLSLSTLLAALGLVHLSLGGYLARVFTSDQHLALERGVYRLTGVDPRSQQRWSTYAMACLALAVVSVLLLTALVLGQTHLPLSTGEEQSRTGALNTAVSFVTNTNWQSYAGEVGASRLAVAGAVALLAGGVIQNLNAPEVVQTLSGGQQSIGRGLVATQESIKLLGTNGGGYFNANSAHPFENPNALTNLLQVFLILMIPVALPRAYGLMVGDRRQGWAVLGFMTTLFVAALAVTTYAEPRAAGGPLRAMEGKEVRFGLFGSTLFATATTATSTGAVNSMHESYSPIGGGTLLGELSPGGATAIGHRARAGLPAGRWLAALNLTLRPR